VSDLRIVHLYPDTMNIYGDTGNVTALAQRLRWRGIEPEVVQMRVGDPLDLLSADLVVAGGGEDQSQLEVADDLQRRSHDVHEAVAADTVFLTICGTYQLFGHRFVTHEGAEIPGIGVFDAETHGGKVRMIGNMILDSPWGQLVGFENHSGRTFLAPDQEPLGRATKGNGNNDQTSDEGAVTRNAFGTYLHGSLLPKNPVLADELLLRALRRRHGPDVSLEPLDDTVEMRAAESAARRP
jgi:CobQ-like glutamine amidotransferase family enzyme